MTADTGDTVIVTVELDPDDDWTLEVERVTADGNTYIQTRDYGPDRQHAVADAEQVIASWRDRAATILSIQDDPQQRPGDTPD